MRMATAVENGHSHGANGTHGAPDGAEPLPPLKTMRDFNDYCIKRGIPSLAQGMIELPPPTKLRQIAAECALSDDLHTYRNRFGESEFRDAIENLLRREYATNVPAGSVLATHGVSGGVVATLAWVCAQGKRRIGLVEPFYTYHIFQIERLFGHSADVTYVPLTPGDFRPDWAAFERALAKGLDLLIVCNPSNPTGKVWAADDMRRLAGACKAAGCVLLLDECYSDMVYGGHQHFSPVEDRVDPNVVVVRGFSKVLGCQSWRVGYLVSAPVTVGELMRVMDPIYICVPWLQHALGRYLSGSTEDFAAHKKACSDLIRRNWGVLSSAFQRALGWEPIEPDGTMYGMFRHARPTDMAAAEDALRIGVGVCPGSMFFAHSPAHTGYIRIHCGISAEKADHIAAVLLRGR